MKKQYNILLFDLDRTLYPPECGVWDAVGDRIHTFIQMKLNLSLEDAMNLRIRLREKYQSTMRGMHEEFNTNNQEFLEFVHDINLNSLIPANPALPKILSAIPQRKYIFTNSITFHAVRILKYLHISEYFEDIIDAQNITPYTKFEREAFPIALGLLGNPDPAECVMIDDEESIVENAKQEGLRGILVNKQPQQNGYGHIQIPSIDQIEEGLRQLAD